MPVVMEDVTAGAAIVVQGEEVGAAFEVIAGVVLGFRIEVVTVVVGEAEAAIEEGDGTTTDAVVLVTVSAGADVEIA